MVKYLKLLEFELKRACPFTLILMGITLVGQLAIFLKGYLEARAFPPQSLYAFHDFFDRNIYYNLLVGAMIMSVFIYALYTWIREWLGEGKFIYRLATLPGSRLALGLAKLTSILVIIFSLLLVQQLVFRLVNQLIVLTGIHDTLYWVDLYTSQHTNLSSLVMPSSFRVFAISYLYGIGFLCMVTNGLLVFLIHFRIRFSWMLAKLLAFSLVSIGLLGAILWLVNRQLGLIYSESWIELALVSLYILGQLAFMKYLLDSKLTI